MACPESEVPAARKVTGTPCLAAMGRILVSSSSLCTCAQKQLPTAHQDACKTMALGLPAQLSNPSGSMKDMQRDLQAVPGC